MSAKSQVWSLDVTIAILIFSGGVIAFYYYSVDSLEAKNQDIDLLITDTKIISGYLTSAGYPKNWTSEDVTLIGLIDEELRLNKEKVKQFSEMALSDYERTRRLLSTTHDYYVFFEDRNSNRVSIEGIDEIGKDYTEENPKNLIKVVRFVIFNSDIIKMVIYIW